MEELLNNKIIRIIIGTVIGLPVTLIALVLSFYGLVFGFIGAIEGNFLSTYGIATITGIVGIIGAWKRILTSTNEMSENEKHTTRVMLYFGFITSIIMGVTLLNTTEYKFSIVLFIISAVSVLFIYATPKSSNKSVKQTG